MLALATLGAHAQSAPASAPAARPKIHLISPLTEPTQVTSSFGERRLTHLHSGYDLSTAEQIGWPVVAPADGEIFRLKVERRGYGRAIYLRHADGFSTNYGHLHAFEESTLKLESRVREAQKSSGRWPGDLYFDPPIPVKAGQVIAFSGEAGVGLPHLHFELRLNDAPVDPAIYSDLRLPAPGEVIPAAIWVIPPAGAERAVRTPLTRAGDGTYGPREPVAMNQGDRLALEIHDQGPGRRRGPGPVKIFLDGAPFYEYRIETFDFKNYFEAGWVYNPVLSGGGRMVLNLHPPAIDPAAMLLRGVRFAADDALTPGEHLLELNASGMNTLARARIPLRVEGFAPARTGERSTVSVELNSGVQLSYAPWAVILPPQGLPFGTLSARSAPAPSQSGLKSTAVEEIFFSPSEFYSREPLILSVALVRTANADIYYFDDRANAWQAMNAEKGDGVLISKVRGLGRFAVFHDEAAPVIGAFAQRVEPRLNLVRYYWPVSDAGEGISVDGCRITDAKAGIELEFDPDRGWAQFFRPPEWRLPAKLAIVCADRAGNSSSPVRAVPKRRQRRR